MTPFQSYPQATGGFGFPSFQQPQTINQVQYVNGMESAKAYSLRPNESAILMDNNNPIFYHVQADASGYRTIKAYQFQEVHEDKPEDIYLTKKEFRDWISQIQNRKQNGGSSDESSKK